MPKLSLLQNNFSAGELSPLFSARSESELHQQGLETCENYVPIVQGPLLRRPGSEFVWEVKDSSRFTRMVPFTYSTEQVYMLEFGHLYIRFYKDGEPILETAKNITGATKANPVVITSNAHGFSNGDEVYITGVGGMTELNGRRFIVANQTANTFELSGVNGTGYTTYTSGGTVARIYTNVTTYTEAELPELRFAQSADVLYICHKDHPPATLNRYSDTSWAPLPFDNINGPFQSAPTDIVVSVVRSGAGPYTYTITASSDLFVNSPLDKQLFRWLSGGVWHDGELTYTSATVAAVQNHPLMIADVTSILDYRIGVMYGGNYPSFCLFHEDRFCFGGYPDFPGRIDMSESGYYTSFSPFESDGSVVASNAISVTLLSKELDAALWAVSDERGMFIGTTGSEYCIKPSSYGEALTPTNVNAKRVSSHGSANVEPVQVGKATLFVQGVGRKLRELLYVYASDGHEAEDLSRAAEHITAGGIEYLAYQKEPFPIVWAVRGDGALLSMTYERMGDALKVGWARHWIGGVSDAAGTEAQVESIAVINDETATRQELWMVVKRYINGGTKRYIEVLTKFFDSSDDQELAFHVDSGSVLNNPVTITGATAANPVVITATSHGFSNGDRVRITDITGMTELNGNSYTVANKTANTFELSGVNGTSYTAYISGGKVRKKVTTISGLDHLEGQTVQIYGDGAPQADKTVSSGAITLSSAASIVIVGLGFTSKIKTLRANINAAIGSSHGKLRRVIEVTLDLYRTLGMKIGKSFDALNTIHFRTTGTPMGHAPEIFSGFKREPINFDTDQDNQICIQQSQPTPGTIRAVQYDVKGEG